MEKHKQDIWAQWILHRRFAGDREQMNAALANFLYPVRDKVLSHARLSDGETLLDVGCGDGLIAFGALEAVKTSKVIFSDISQDLLDHVQALATEMQMSNRCEFLRASADDLSSVGKASIDVLTTRSVLIYVSAKQKAFDEFFRVLKPKGRLSIFEPINRFAWPEPAHLLDGYDVTPILEIAQKVKTLYLHLQPPDIDPMINFDEDDLLTFAEQAGFSEIHLELQVEVKSHKEVTSWEAFMRVAGNPKIPSLEEAITQTLTPLEAEKFTAHLRPIVDAGKGTARSSLAYLWATKG